MVFDDAQRTATTKEQQELEKKLIPGLRTFIESDSEQRLKGLELKRDAHVKFLQRHIGRQLPEPFSVLDASQTWVVYWTLHSLSLLNAPLPENVASHDIVEFLKSCQHETGGFGGGPQQLPHLAATYAAVMSLVTLGTQEALDAVDRPRLEAFLLNMCVAPEKGGGLTVHEDGEIDIRGCYTAMALAHVLNLDMHSIAEKCGMIEFIRKCQSFDGGLGGEPGNEAHGGYTYCGLAALILLDRIDAINVPALVRWVVHMQGSMEGGFKGRTHKLVDGCYSFWQGTTFALIKNYFAATTDPWLQLGSPLSEDTEALDNLPMYDASVVPYSPHQEAMNQGEKKLRKRAEELALDLEEGLRFLVRRTGEGDIPFERRLRLDLFQSTFEECQATMHAIDVAFSVAFPIGSEERRQLPVTRMENRDEHEQQLFDNMGLQFWILLHCQMEMGGLRDKPNKAADPYHTCYCLSGLSVAQHSAGIVLGPEQNALVETDPLLNVITEKAKAAVQYYKSLG